MSKSILDMISKKLLNERLDDVLLSNPEYVETMDEIDRLTEKVKDCSFNEEEQRAVKELISAYLTQNACYSRFAYQQGLKDASVLMLELGLVKLDT